MAYEYVNGRNSTDEQFNWYLHMLEFSFCCYCWFIAQVLIKVFNLLGIVYTSMYTSFLLVVIEFALLCDFEVLLCANPWCCWGDTSEVSTKFSLVVVSRKTLDLSYLADVLLVSQPLYGYSELSIIEFKFYSAQTLLPLFTSLLSQSKPVHY